MTRRSLPRAAPTTSKGLRGHFGDVSAARVIDARNHQVGSGDDGRTYYVADLLLQTARGAAVVELEFDSLQLISDTITDVRELEPREIKGLDDAELTAVAKAFVARGGEPANELRHLDVLADARGEGSGPSATPPPVAKPKKAAVSPEIRKAKQQLRCVQRAKGDVEQAGTLHFVTYTKYPRTWHLPDSPNRGADGDHAHEDYSTFEGREVVVTEKLDGENTTIYADGHTHARSLSSGYHPTRTWVRALAGRVAHALPDGWRICGENTYGRHSIAYDRLPSYFQLFAVYDDRRHVPELGGDRGVGDTLGRRPCSAPVPRPVRAREPSSRCSAVPSAFGPEREGIVLRWADAFPFAEHQRAVGKLVRRDHVKTEQHWMHGEVTANGLARDA